VAGTAAIPDALRFDNCHKHKQSRCIPCSLAYWRDRAVSHGAALDAVRAEVDAAEVGRISKVADLVDNVRVALDRAGSPTT
jgi:hypothetical protein